MTDPHTHGEPDELHGLDPAGLMRAGLDRAAASPGPGEFVAPDLEQLRPLFAGYELLELVGQGGMGAVYRARHERLDRIVALKVLPPSFQADPSFPARFQQEARALARLNHPGIVAVHDYGEAGEYPYLAMEFVSGSNLRQRLAAGPLAPEQVRALALQLCDALAAAHAQGVVHRDVKPENILIDARGDARLADFGLAKLSEAGLAPSLTRTRHAVGTPHYVAPEQLESPASADHRVDLYALGVLLYELLTGRLPLGRFAAPSERQPAVPPAWDAVVLRLLESEPDRRFQSAREARAAIERVAPAVPVPVPPRQEAAPMTSPAPALESPPSSARAPARTHRGAIASLICALLVLPIWTGVVVPLLWIRADSAMEDRWEAERLRMELEAQRHAGITPPAEDVARLDQLQAEQQQEEAAARARERWMLALFLVLAASPFALEIAAFVCGITARGAVRAADGALAGWGLATAGVTIACLNLLLPLSCGVAAFLYDQRVHAVLVVLVPAGLFGAACVGLYVLLRRPAALTTS